MCPEGRDAAWPGGRPGLRCGGVWRAAVTQLRGPRAAIGLLGRGGRDISGVRRAALIVLTRVWFLAGAWRRGVRARPAVRRAGWDSNCCEITLWTAREGGGTSREGPCFPACQVSTQLWICCHRRLMILLTPLSENEFLTPHLVDSIPRV